MKKYSYHGINKIKQIAYQLFGFIGISFFTIFGLLWISGGINLKSEFNHFDLINDPRYTLLCVGIWTILFAWIIGSIFLNYLPIIWTDEDGITITTFVIFHTKIPWSDVIDIGNGSLPKGYMLVRTRKITLFHIPIGWMYSKTLHPSFLIDKGIENYDRLFQEIRNKKSSF